MATRRSADIWPMRSIHLKRAFAETILGGWIFSGLPEFSSGLRLSHDGAPGNASLIFEHGAQDAELLWNDSANRFDLNRALKSTGSVEAPGGLLSTAAGPLMLRAMPTSIPWPSPPLARLSNAAARPTPL